ncbi:MAG: 50S ribosomal protein L30 [Bacteroidota bacterium]
MAKIKITKIKSTIGQSERVERNLEALGLRKINSTNEVEVTPQILGIIRKVNHLIKVENI